MPPSHGLCCWGPPSQRRHQGGTTPVCSCHCLRSGVQLWVWKDFQGPPAPRKVEPPFDLQIPNPIVDWTGVSILKGCPHPPCSQSDTEHPVRLWGHFHSRHHNSPCDGGGSQNAGTANPHGTSVSPITPKWRMDGCSGVRWAWEPDSVSRAFHSRPSSSYFRSFYVSCYLHRLTASISLAKHLIGCSWLGGL